MSAARRTYVSFEWDSADDAEFDRQENLVAPGGRNIIESIRDSLREHGFLVADIEMHESFGWSVKAHSGDVPVWCMLQDAGPWLLITDVPLKFLQWVRGRNPNTHHFRVCVAVHNALATGGRARMIRWFSRREYDQNTGEGVDKP